MNGVMVRIETVRFARMIPRQNYVNKDCNSGEFPASPYTLNPYSLLYSLSSLFSNKNLVPQYPTKHKNMIYPGRGANSNTPNIYQWRAFLGVRIV